MTTQVENKTEEPDTECSICGRVPGPAPECEICGGNKTFTQSRAYTLTEERQGQSNDPDRYSRTGNVSPKVVLVPGGFDPTQGNKNQ